MDALGPTQVENPDDFQGKVVMDLGAGSGIPLLLFGAGRPVMHPKGRFNQKV